MPVRTLQKFIVVRRKKRANAKIPLIVGVVLLWSLRSASSKDFTEIVRLRLLQEQKQSRDEGQKYFLKNKSHFSDSRIFWLKSQRQLRSKNYVTRSFLGIHNSWIGKKVFLYEAQSAWWGSRKELKKKVFPTSSFSRSSEICGFIGKEFQTCSYPIKTFYPEATVQGALDHDLEQSFQQKKSPAEVRAMLEKEF